MPLSRSYDADYRLSVETAGSLFNQRYEYDGVGNIAKQHDDSGTARQETYAYDELDRLTSTLGTTATDPARAYDYDAVGNRIALDVGSVHTGYRYDLASQRLVGVDRSGSATAYATKAVRRNASRFRRMVTFGLADRLTASALRSYGPMLVIIRLI